MPMGLPQFINGGLSRGAGKRFLLAGSQVLSPRSGRLLATRCLAFHSPDTGVRRRPDGNVHCCRRAGNYDWVRSGLVWSLTEPGS